jgi:hypothetical protein
VIKGSIKYFIFAFVLLPLSVLAQDDVSVEMHISPDTIGLDGQAYLSIVISSTIQNLPDPVLPNLSMFNANSQGTSTNISIVNGVIEATNVYNYLLYPKRQGTFVIKPASVVYNRKRYESREISLTVLESGVGTPKKLQEEAKGDTGESRDVFLVAELDKKTAYVNEQITLTVKFYHAVKLLSQPDYNPPQTTDFWSDNLGSQRSYYETINGRRYSVIELNTALFPTRSDELRIGSAAASVKVPTRRSRRRRDPFDIFNSFFEQGEVKTVRSKALTINILPLPQNGKPEDFSGTVGNFSISSTIDKTKVEVNQPVTVTYKIHGTGNIKTVAEPKIDDLPDFRVYRASSDEKVSTIKGKIGGTKVFEETYIPKRAGKLVIPAVSLNFFDPSKKKYKTISTKRISIESIPTALTEYADLPIPNVAGRVIDPNAKDIRYIKLESGSLELKKPLVIGTPLYVIINGLPVVILLAAVVGRRRREKLTGDIGYARSKAAKKMARKRLSRARKIAETGKHGQFYAEIRQALFSYIADKLNISPYGLTGDKILEIVASSGLDEDTTEKIQDLLKQADFAQYSSAERQSPKTNEALEKAEDILVKLNGAELG